MRGATIHRATHLFDIHKELKQGTKRISSVAAPEDFTEIGSGFQHCKQRAKVLRINIIPNYAFNFRDYSNVFRCKYISLFDS